MSNLKLEDTNMYRLLRTKKFQYRWGKLGHNTYAFATLNTVRIQYHGNTIADLRRLDHGLVVQITDAGLGTPTTRNRLNKILNDNEIPACTYQSNFEQILNWSNDEKTKPNLWSTWFPTGYGHSVVHYAEFERKYFQEAWKVIY